MLNWVSLGPVSIPASWAAIVAAFIITGMFLFITRKKAASDWYGDAIFIFIVVWKLSVIVFHLKTTLANPMSIVYFNGGVKGYGLGVVGALLYTIISKKGSTIVYSEVVISWILTVTAYELVYGVLNETGIFPVVVHFLSNLVLLTIAIIKAPNRLWMLQVIILFTSIQGLFYTLKDDLLSLPMATYVLLAIFFYFWRKNRGDDQ